MLSILCVRANKPAAVRSFRVKKKKKKKKIYKLVAARVSKLDERSHVDTKKSSPTIKRQRNKQERLLKIIGLAFLFPHVGIFNQQV